MFDFINNIPPWVVICVVLAAMMATEIARELMGGNG